MLWGQTNQGDMFSHTGIGKNITNQFAGLFLYIGGFLLLLFKIDRRVGSLGAAYSLHHHHNTQLCLYSCTHFPHQQ
jgi:hypothetical protein